MSGGYDACGLDLEELKGDALMKFPEKFDELSWVEDREGEYFVKVFGEVEMMVMDAEEPGMDMEMGMGMYGGYGQ